MEKFFNFNDLKTNLKTEILGGFSAFVGMAYIIILIPNIMQIAGFDYGASYVALCTMAFLSSLFMGIYAKVPFASAPYLGEGAFLTYTIILAMGINTYKALGVIFICGIILLISTLLNIRPKLVNSIPKSLKFSFTIGLGMFLFYTGLSSIGLVQIQNNTPSIGNILNFQTLFALLGILTIFILTVKKNKYAILVGIGIATLMGIFAQDVKLPQNIFSAIPSMEPLFLKADIMGALDIKLLPVIFIMLIIIFADTMGTTITLASRANLLDKEGNLPNIKRVMLVDSISTILAPLFGTVTTGTYAEGVVGIEAGAKSGLAPIVTGFLFLGALFLAPLINVIPPYATGCALIAIGISMISLINEIDFNDNTEYIPALFAILVMVLSKNLGVGMIFGFILSPVLKFIKSGRSAINITNSVLFIASLLFLIFYPY